MRICVILYCFFLSQLLCGSVLKPCEAVGFDRVAEYAIPPGGGIGEQIILINGKKNAINFLKKCLTNYAVCIFEKNSQSFNLFSQELIEPKNSNFDPVNRELVFGMLQYVDKKNGLSICIAAQNSFTNSVPWLGKSWVINGETIKEYELYGAQFTTVMTPKSLFKALLKEHKDALDAERYHEEELKKTISTAKGMLDTGSDPDFIAKVTGLSLENVKLLQ